MTQTDPASSVIAAALRLLQFGDSMLPVGAFSFSNALESAVQEGVVFDRDTLAQFVRTATRRAATADGVALLQSHRAILTGRTDRLALIDHAVLARKLDEEMRTQSVRMGKKLIEVAAAVTDSDTVHSYLKALDAGLTPGTFCVAMGLVCAEIELSEAQAFSIHQYGGAVMLTGAALRLMRIDHLTTQSILAEVGAWAAHDYEDVRNAQVEDMASFAPMTDILAAVHARSHVRLFMS